jgi:hypothetical protein
VGVISFDDIVGSAVVAALVSGLIGLTVARSAARAAMKAARFTAAEARGKEARAALGRAIDGWHIASKREVDLRGRQQGAGRVRAALIELSMIPGFAIKTREFAELIGVLAATNEDDLKRAEALWSSVELQLRDAVAPAPPAPSIWRKLVRRRR